MFFGLHSPLTMDFNLFIAIAVPTLLISGAYYFFSQPDNTDNLSSFSPSSPSSTVGGSSLSDTVVPSVKDVIPLQPTAQPAVAPRGDTPYYTASEVNEMIDAAVNDSIVQRWSNTIMPGEPILPGRVIMDSPSNTDSLHRISTTNPSSVWDHIVRVESVESVNMDITSVPITPTSLLIPAPIERVISGGEGPVSPAPLPIPDPSIAHLQGSPLDELVKEYTDTLTGEEIAFLDMIDCINLFF